MKVSVFYLGNKVIKIGSDSYGFFNKYRMKILFNKKSYSEFRFLPLYHDCLSKGDLE